MLIKLHPESGRGHPCPRRTLPNRSHWKNSPGAVDFKLWPQELRADTCVVLSPTGVRVHRLVLRFGLHLGEVGRW